MPKRCSGLQELGQKKIFVQEFDQFKNNFIAVVLAKDKCQDIFTFGDGTHSVLQNFWIQGTFRVDVSIICINDGR